MGIAYNPSVVTDGMVLALDAANPKSYTGVTTSVTTTIEDPYADNVSLLLNGNDLTDSSSHNHTLSNTNITVDTTTKKYGSGSLEFSTSAYGTFPHDTSFDIGTGDFTIEAWVYPQNSGTRGIAHNHPSFTGGGFTFYLNSSSKLVIQNWTVNSTSKKSIASTTTAPNGTWAHVAYSRSGGTGYLFIDGNLEGTHTDSTNLTNNSAFYIGVAEGSSYKGIGYIDDLRFTVGVGRYTSSFTPPAAELYLSTTETQQAPVLTDISLNNNTATLYNGVGYTSSNLGYFTFDGTNNYMEIPYDESVNLTDGDFTIDFWMNSFADQTSDVLVSYGNTSNVGGWAIKTATNKLQYSVGFATHPAVAGIVTSGLVVHLDAGNSNSYPGSGTTWNDLSGNGNNGTISGATYDSANGGSLSFDGTNDYVTTGTTLTDADELFANTGTAWSTSSWFNVDVIGGADKAVTGRGGGTGSSATYVVYINTADLRVRLRGGTITNISTSIATNTWYNVVVTWDGTTANGYLNGQFVTTLAVGTASKQTNTFTIGATASGTSSEFDGKISQTLVYNKALTASEIQRNYNALKGRYTSQPSSLDPLDLFNITENADFSSGITTNTWNHYALVRSGNVYTPYVNAVPGNPSYDYSADLNRDLYFDNASIILNANGDNGSTNIIDSSKNNHTGIITAYSGAGISTAEYKFGGSSLYFDGTDDYIDCGTDSSYAMEDGDFTIEFWMYTDQANSGNYLFRIGPRSESGNNNVPDGSLAVYAYTVSGGSGSITFERKRGGGAAMNDASIIAGQWNHIAWTRSGSNFYHFVNGALIFIHSSTYGNPYNENHLTIGCQYRINSDNTDYYYNFFNGYIDDFIITKGVAKYTSDFTPPNQASYYSNDPNYDNLSILLQGNGTNGSTDIIDSSPNNHTGIITAYSGAGISTAEYKFGGSSLYFDGTDDYIDCGASDAYSFGTGDFTIEFWHYIVASNQTWYAGGKIFSTINLNNSPGISLSVYGNPSSGLQFYWQYSVGNSSTSFNASMFAPINEWYHVAWGRKNGASLFFVNGEKKFEFTQTYTQADYTNNTLALGKDLQSIYEYMGESYIDDFRITKGVAKYTEDFIPPDRTKIQNNQASLKFGASGTDNSNPFNGALSNLKIYKDSLTQSEITQNFNAHKSRYGL